MVPGLTFFIPLKVDPHRRIIISDPAKYPAEDLVIVNFTSEGDITCVIFREEFSALAHDSCISYRDAGKMSPTFFNAWVANGNISISQTASKEVLKKIREGFSRSKEPANDLKDILRQQGLIS